jgi:predicted acylesterase/phospholipase RssA
MTAGTTSDRSPRLGLALSGGGFRASLFHIGVLARLAELDLLRAVQVISTVSGGSIIGALYYLHVRNLLQRTADADITRDDYVAMIDEIQRTFPVAIQHNLRMRTFGDAVKNLRMYGRGYSRSDRMAELYEEFLYAPVVEEALKRGVPLPALAIQPHGERPGFHPFAADAVGRTPNDRRANKVPALVINATTLNTGHNFQFTTTWLGEPPNRPDQGDLDRNLRLRRAYYDRDNLPLKFQRLPLAVAVAASATVPGLFPPLALTDLYPQLTPQLVDGGVHDNQGIEGLLDLDCTHLIVSDASGQMDDVPDPKVGPLAVLKRSNDVLMDRVREEEYVAARLMERPGGITMLVLFHLKECLQQEELTWMGGTDKPNQVLAAVGRTPYGVDQRTQDLLASIRTDLDAFSEIEAHALMTDGYLIARHSLPAALRAGLGRDGAEPPAHPWAFRDVEAYLRDPESDPAFSRQLGVGSATVGKSLQLVPWLAWSTQPFVRAALVAALLVGVVALVDTIDSVGLTALAVFAAVSLGGFLAQLSPWRAVQAVARAVRSVVPGLVVGPSAALAVLVHLRTLNVLRMHYGRIATLRAPRPAAAPPADRRAA